MQELPTIDLKGKKYTMVKDRVAFFNETYKNGQIHTEIINNDKNMVIFKATVTPDVSVNRVFNAHSFGTIDEVKAFEKLESVAVGRALAMMGIGIIESIASADEMQRFESRQVQNSKSTSTTRKNNPIKFEVGDQLKTGNKNGKNWYGIKKKDGAMTWLTPDQYEYMQNYTGMNKTAQLAKEVFADGSPIPTADDALEGLPF